jgi:hypothetical protein
MDDAADNIKPPLSVSCRTCRANGEVHRPPSHTAHIVAHTCAVHQRAGALVGVMVPVQVHIYLRQAATTQVDTSLQGMAGRCAQHSLQVRVSRLALCLRNRGSQSALSCSETMVSPSGGRLTVLLTYRGRCPSTTTQGVMDLQRPLIGTFPALQCWHTH